MQQLNLWDSAVEQRLNVLRASRTEWLAERLAEHLERARPADPLQAQTIVIGHKGLRRWLLGQFARRGGRGIAANLDIVLPWEWLQRTARAVLGEDGAIGDYRRDTMRWHVFAALSDLDEPQVSAYLRGADAARRSFALAERVAGVFEQYLIYRPDWILDWERNRRPQDWQGRLWRRVRETIGKPHRAQRGAALCAALARSGDGESLPLHVFGVSHLAPDVLAALRALAPRRLVNVYFPDPCREHWVYFRTQRAQLKLTQGQAQYYEVGHPLLAGLGRMGQDFCIALEEIDADEQRDAGDESEPSPPSESLLAQLQASIRYATPELIGADTRPLLADLPKDDSPDDAAAAEGRARLYALRADGSLRVHACHTRLRELEVLRDALLGFLAEDATLTHADIVVMAPDISLYAPSLPAVFGEAARYEPDPARIPWHLSDVTLARSHPLISAFLRLLDLRESRFTVSEVMDFLDVPAIARRFRIDDAARAKIEHALRRARVAWGLDAGMKAQAGGAPVAANSWRFGFDRLYAGYLLGEDDADALDGVLPVAGIDDGMAESLGRMDELLGALRDTRDGLAQVRTLAEWSAWLRQCIDALFRADGRDEAESAALTALQRVLVGLADQADAAGRNTELPWDVLRDVVRDVVDAVSERQPFLYGGVTFCGLVPHRSIPFRVVCLLGMNEREFPRAVADAELNRMLDKPRRGDRDARNEDRYLFLEALMSARQRLHISYVGTDVASGKTLNPAAPLADVLQLLDEQHRLTGRAHDAWPRPWLVRHPLQPFDARYYTHHNDRDDGGTARHDPRLFSFAPTFADVPATATGAAGAFLDIVASNDRALDSEPITLATLKRFWRDPAKAILRDDAGIGLEALGDDDWPDREPLDAKTDRRERVERRLLLDALQRGEPIPALPPPWLALSGMLAAGEAGRIAYHRVRDCAMAAVAAARDELGERVQLDSQSVQLDLGDGVRLAGKIDDVYRAADGRLWRFDARLTRAADFGDLLPLYIDCAALTLGVTADVATCFLENVSRPQSTDVKIATPPLLAAIRAQSNAQLARGLRRLIDLRAQAIAQPIVFPPKTAWAWASTDAQRREHAALAAWRGDRYGATGESDFSDSHAALLARHLDFLQPGSEAQRRFAALVQDVADVLDPTRTVLARGDTDV